MNAIGNLELLIFVERTKLQNLEEKPLKHRGVNTKLYLFDTKLCNIERVKQSFTANYLSCPIYLYITSNIYLLQHIALLKQF